MVRIPAGMVEIDTGTIYVCPLTGQQEMPFTEVICPADERTISWTCAYFDAFMTPRGAPGYRADFPQWHQAIRGEHTEAASDVAATANV